MERERLSGLILAGGGSRRFGSNKALYGIGGKPMIERVADAVRPLVGEVLISVGADVPNAMPGRLVFDRFPGCGPLAGLHAGLSEAHTPRVLVAACDMPYLTTEALRRLTGSDAPAVVAVDAGGRRHPLCACYDASIQHLVERRLRSGALSVRGLIDALDVAEVRLPDDVLRNVNTLSDLG